MPKLPDWLPEIAPRDEKKRAAAGLIPKPDGWYKTLAGKTRYVCKPCPVADALELLPSRLEAIRRTIGLPTVAAVPVARGTLTLEQVYDKYQAWLWQRLTTGNPKKLARRTYDDAIETLDAFVEIAGPQKRADAVGPNEFSDYSRKHLAGKAASTRRRRIIYIEAFANWASPGSRKAGLLVRPWQYGPDFAKPSDSEISRAAADSDKAYTAAQLRQAFLRVRRSPMLRAAGWLGLCAAFGPKDLGTLPEAIVDLKEGFIRFPRGKTGVGRLCHLPAAARIAVKRYMDGRGIECDPSASGLVFRSGTTGLPLFRESDGESPGVRYDSIGNQWSKLTGLPFSGLRSTFATHADEHSDQRAVDVVMGHLTGHTKSIRRSHYAKRINPERIRQLVSYVVPRAFGRTSPAPAAAPSASAQRPPVAPASPPAPAASDPPRQGRSGKAGSTRPASARPSRRSRHSE